MKNKRQEALLNLIKEKVIVTQDDLQYELERLGFEVTQSTVSRDIKALRIVKGLSDDGQYRYMVPPQHISSSVSGNREHYTDILSKCAVTVRFASNDVVVKCHSGMASSACVAIDTLFPEHIVGSLAGDDTIIIVTEGELAASVLTEKISNLL